MAHTIHPPILYRITIYMARLLLATKLAAESAKEALARLRELAKYEHVTRVVVAHDLQLSTAPVIRDMLLHPAT
jgi:hypothetical protein